MGEALSVDLAALRRSASRQREIADRARLAAADLKRIIDSAGAAWGTDKPGKVFEESYLPSAQQSAEALDEMVSALDSLGSELAGTADAFESKDLVLGNHIDRTNPYADVPAARSTGPGIPAAPAASASLSSTPRPAASPEPGDGQQLSEAGSLAPGESRAPAAPGQTPGSDDHLGSGDPARPPTPESPAGVPGQRQAGSAPGSPPGAPGVSTPPGYTAQSSPNRPGGTAPASAAPGANTPWSPSGTPKGAAGPPGKGVSAPPSSGRPGEAPPPRPSTPAAPRRPAKTETPPRPAPRPASRPQPEPAAHPPVTARRRDIPTDPEVLRIAGEMATRHGLTLVGFETSGLTEPAVRELVDALDTVLTTHHLLDLRVVQVSETRDTATTEIEWDRIEGMEGAATQAARLILNREKFVVPEPAHSPEGSTAEAAAPTRVLYGVVVRELGRALDAMGGYAARRRVQRVLIRHFLDEVAAGHSRRSLGRVVADYRQWRTTVPGATASNFDPGSVLVEAFAAVVAQSPSCGVAEAVYRVLVEAADGGR